MKRRKIMVAAGFCLSFFLGTLMNLLFIPGFEHHQNHGDRQRANYHHRQPKRIADNAQLHVGEPLTVPAAEVNSRHATSSWREQRELQMQIRERLEEVLRYRQRQAQWSDTGDDAFRPLERRRLMDLEPAVYYELDKGNDRLDTRRTEAQTKLSRAVPNTAKTQHVFWMKSDRFKSGQMLGCHSIDNVTNIQYLGSGYTKAVYKATINSSLSVALKSVDFGGHDMENCMKKYGSAENCYRLASFKIVKEMTLMEQLQHPNILQVAYSVFAHYIVYSF